MIRCIWVEDEPRDAKGFALELAAAPGDDGFGWHVDRVRTLAEALEKLAAEVYNVLVLDVMLPNDQQDLGERLVNVGAGLELLRRLSDASWEGKTKLREPAPARFPVVVVWTAVISEETKAAIESLLGADDFYLEKPVSPQGFYEVFGGVRKRLAS